MAADPGGGGGAGGAGGPPPPPTRHGEAELVAVDVGKLPAGHRRGPIQPVGQEGLQAQVHGLSPPPLLIVTSVTITTPEPPPAMGVRHAIGLSLRLRQRVRQRGAAGRPAAGAELAPPLPPWVPSQTGNDA